MTKRLLLLGGISILAVVLNHAAGYGQIALFLWADSYLPVSVPYWAALGSLMHWILIAVRSIAAFAVPAFLFISGFFSVYMLRGNVSISHQWKTVFRRVLSLVIPYLVWSVITFSLDALRGSVYKPLEYVVKLLTTGASGHLFFVPLLCSCYLLSPWVVALARKRPRLLLSVSALLLVGALAVHYLRRLGVPGIALLWMVQVTPAWSVTWWIVFFALGSVTALNIQRTKELLTHYRWQILAMTVVFWAMNILEGNTLLQTYRTDWIAGIDTVSYSLFAISVLVCFLAFSDLQIWGSEALYELGKRSYGIYLAHIPIISLTARVIRRIAPWMLAYQALLVLLLFVAGLGLALLAMEAVRRWPLTRRVYRYLFG